MTFMVDSSSHLYIFWTKRIWVYITNIFIAPYFDYFFNPCGRIFPLWQSMKVLCFYIYGCIKLLVVIYEGTKTQSRNAFVGMLFSRITALGLFRNELHHIYKQGLQSTQKKTHQIYLGSKQIISPRKIVFPLGIKKLPFDGIHIVLYYIFLQKTTQTV